MGGSEEVDGRADGQTGSDRRYSPEAVLSTFCPARPPVRPSARPPVRPSARPPVRPSARPPYLPICTTTLSICCTTDRPACVW
jgi:hypothetical protein